MLTAAVRFFTPRRRAQGKLKLGKPERSKPKIAKKGDQQKLRKGSKEMRTALELTLSARARCGAS